jgi:hypothetical protein
MELGIEGLRIAEGMEHRAEGIECRILHSSHAEFSWLLTTDYWILKFLITVL